MATLVFGSLGTMLGGPLGGAIGSMIGSQVDSLAFGSRRQGPRLKELAVTSSSYGQPIPRHFGRMRVAGTVIWATDLVEHDEVVGAGKGSPAITTYSYTANFAVALASRPILGIGRIWADGKLLRGDGGDLKTGGILRIYDGTGAQAPDPLIVAAEGADRCPAYRGLAYVVFENLDLSDFYNRIPSLTFEVIADTAFDLQSVLGHSVQDVDAHVPLDGIEGYSAEGPPATDLAVFEQVMPLEIDATDTLVVTRERLQDEVILLPPPAVITQDDGFGAVKGFARSRAAPSAQPISVLRYYDVARDYQASVQRATGRATAGEAGTIDLPAALDAGTARALIERTARRIDWTRDRVSWRTSELDMRIAPGALVRLPEMRGDWRVRTWEWRDGGVELVLERALPQGARTAPPLFADPGRGNPPPDVPFGPSRIVAFELPFDGTGSPDVPRPVAAVGSNSARWAGAALYADRGDGQLQALGPSGRRRAVIGTAQTVLPAASPLLVDRGSQLVVTLVDSSRQLTSADTRRIAEGANMALVGEELVQFLNAVPLEPGRWRLENLLRGRGGTEAAIGGHAEGEAFALLDGHLSMLDPALLGTGSGRSVIAIGRADTEPAHSPVYLDGLTLRPLAPVHPRLAVTGNGAWRLAWTRRARGGWAWRDGVDVPLVEQLESYLVSFGTLEDPLATWSVNAPQLTIDAATLASLSARQPGGLLQVRQRGTHALSLPLTLCALP